MARGCEPKPEVWAKPLRKLVPTLAEPRARKPSFSVVFTDDASYASSCEVSVATRSSMNCWLNTVTFIGMFSMGVFIRVASAAFVD